MKRLPGLAIRFPMPGLAKIGDKYLSHDDVLKLISLTTGITERSISHADSKYGFSPRDPSSGTSKI